MSEKLDRRTKIALDETRLLVLGIQMLLGFPPSPLLRRR